MIQGGIRITTLPTSGGRDTHLPALAQRPALVRGKIIFQEDFAHTDLDREGAGHGIALIGGEGHGEIHQAAQRSLGTDAEAEGIVRVPGTRDVGQIGPGTLGVRDVDQVAEGRERTRDARGQQTRVLQVHDELAAEAWIQQVFGVQRLIAVGQQIGAIGGVGLGSTDGVGARVVRVQPVFQLLVVAGMAIPRQREFAVVIVDVVRAVGLATVQLPHDLVIGVVERRARAARFGGAIIPGGDVPVAVGGRSRPGSIVHWVVVEGDLLDVATGVMHADTGGGGLIATIPARVGHVVIEGNRFGQFQQGEVGIGVAGPQDRTLDRIRGGAVLVAAARALVVEHEDPAGLAAQTVVGGQEVLGLVLAHIVDHRAGADPESAAGEDHGHAVDFFGPVRSLGAVDVVVAVARVIVVAAGVTREAKDVAVAVDHTHHAEVGVETHIRWLHVLQHTVFTGQGLGGEDTVGLVVELGERSQHGGVVGSVHEEIGPVRQQEVLVDQIGAGGAVAVQGQAPDARAVGQRIPLARILWREGDLVRRAETQRHILAFLLVFEQQGVHIGSGKNQRCRGGPEIGTAQQAGGRTTRADLGRQRLQAREQSQGDNDGKGTETGHGSPPESGWTRTWGRRIPGMAIRLGDGGPSGDRPTLEKACPGTT